MVQKESSLERDIEDTRAVMTEKIDMIENRVNETMEGTKATIDNVMEKVKGVQETIDTAKSTIDNILETIKHTMEETIERVKYTSTVIEQVDQSPWIMLGSAVLTGYVLGGLRRNRRRDRLVNIIFLKRKVTRWKRLKNLSISMCQYARLITNGHNLKSFPASWKG